MPDRLIDPEDQFRNRYRHILLAQRLRRPLAAMAIAVAILAVIETVLGLNVMLGGAEGGASTHPTTGLTIVFLAVGLIHFRSYTPPPRWRIGLALGVLGFLVITLVLRVCFSIGVPVAVSRLGAMGTDTATIMALLFGSVLVRRRYGVLGLGLALAASAMIIGAFIGLSYGLVWFEGQMSSSTLLAMLPLVLSVLTIYAHRPAIRVVLLSGAVGVRTRSTMVVGCLVPWLGGLILHRGFGVPDRIIPVEAIMIGTTMLSMCVVAVASGLFHERGDRVRRQLAHRLAELALVDHLTGTLNRNGMSSEVVNRWDAFVAQGGRHCLILLDLDHFKRINDRFGHGEGDRVLGAIGTMLRPHLRSGDAIGRWGGEEFLIVISGLDPSDAQALANRLRLAVAGLPTFLAVHSDGRAPEGYAVTGSFGVSFFETTDIGPEEAIKRADVALYAAKAQGRNQVVVGALATAEVA